MSNLEFDGNGKREGFEGQGDRSGVVRAVDDLIGKVANDSLTVIRPLDKDEFRACSRHLETKGGKMVLSVDLSGKSALSNLQAAIRQVSGIVAGGGTVLLKPREGFDPDQPEWTVMQAWRSHTMPVATRKPDIAPVSDPVVPEWNSMNDRDLLSAYDHLAKMNPERSKIVEIFKSRLKSFTHFPKRESTEGYEQASYGDSDSQVVEAFRTVVMAENSGRKVYCDVNWAGKYEVRVKRGTAGPRTGLLPTDDLKTIKDGRSVGLVGQYGKDPLRKEPVVESKARRCDRGTNVNQRHGNRHAGRSWVPR